MIERTSATQATEMSFLHSVAGLSITEGEELRRPSGAQTRVLLKVDGVRMLPGASLGRCFRNVNLGGELGPPGGMISVSLSGMTLGFLQGSVVFGSPH